MGNICEAAAKEPHEASYAGNLQFFTDVVTLLENRSERSRWLVEERSRALLGRAFSRVFSYLLDRDPHFDFDAAIAPVPIAVRGGWRDGWRTMWTPSSGPLRLMMMAWSWPPMKAMLWMSLALTEMLAAAAAMSTTPVMPPRMPKKTR